MHEPIDDSDGDLSLLYASRYDDGRWLSASFGNPGSGWDRENGFAFVVPQLSSFLSYFCGRVLFCNLSTPSAEHFADLV